MKTILKHPYSGYWDDELIGRYAALGDEPMTREEAIEELVESGGFKRVKQSKINRVNTATLLSALVEAAGKMAENIGHMASGLELIAKQAPLLTPPIGVEEVAKVAGVTVKTVYRWKEGGLLKPLADNRPLLFDQGEVHDFMRRRRRGRAS